MKMRTATALLSLAATAWAQQQAIMPQSSTARAIVRPYTAPTVPPIRVSNSSRLDSLIRSGKLYLNVNDAIALAIENNLGLEINRYGPLLAQSALNRALAGGPIRGVPSAPNLVSGADAGLGVGGSTLSAGLGGGGGGGVGGTGTGNASIQQVGPVTPNLDPVLQNATAFSHKSAPQINQRASETTSLVSTTHNYNTIVTQGLLTGGSLQYVNYEQYLKENAPSDVFNPALGPYWQLSLTHNLLQGFGKKINDRGIRIARKNTQAAQEVLRSQLLDLVANVLNLYWQLASEQQQVTARRRALEIAQKFREDTQNQIQLGVLSGVELPRAEAEMASRQQDLSIAEASVRQDETLLKEALSRNEDPQLENAEIVTLDHIEIPATDDLPPLRDLVKRATEKRPDVMISNIRKETDAINTVGTEDLLLPNLQVTGRVQDRGTAGAIQNPKLASPYFEGGYGTALGQILRHNFPTEAASVSLSIPLGNRQSQGDYGIDQLQLRQSDITGRKTANQIVVDISNDMIALRQARARYTAAVKTRQLQEQLLEAEQNEFQSGLSTTSNVVQAQRALVNAQSTETTALTAYARARVAMDQVLGETLEVNHVSFEEAVDGRVNR
ncbi:MAG TPA: TolC family protein [Bryobacteraceae bacterium]|jgi:outer membrane protein TolC